MSKIIIPKPSASELALVSLIAGEHLLIEDIPGTAIFISTPVERG